MKQNNGKGKTAVLVICIIALIFCVVKLQGLRTKNAKLSEENTSLQEEVQSLSEQVESLETAAEPAESTEGTENMDSQSILDQLKNSFDQQDWDNVVKTFLIYKDELQNSEAYKEAEKLFQQAKEKITSSDAYNKLKDEANKLKGDLQDLVEGESETGESES